MDIFSKLRNSAKTGQPLKIFLNNGFTLEGSIIELDLDGIILQSPDRLTAAALKSVIAWQLDTSYQEEEMPALREKQEHIKTQATDNFNDQPLLVPAESTTNQDLDINIKFEPEMRKHINKTPLFLLSPENEIDRKKWDSILSRYQNASKHNNIEQIQFLADEFIQLGSQHPRCSTFYYNAGCLKLESKDYKKAIELFDWALQISWEPEPAYNAARASILSEDWLHAAMYLGIYFSIISPIQDQNMWHGFSDIIRKTREYDIFHIVFMDIIERAYTQSNEPSELIILLATSSLEIFENHSEIRNIINAFLPQNDKDKEELSEEKTMKLGSDIHKQLSENGLLTPNKYFGNIYSALKISREEAGQSTEDIQCIENMEDREIGTQLTDPSGPVLKKGFIYRAIPPHRYGFLKDEDGISYHFKYDVLEDNIRYIESSTEDNPIRVFFKSRPTEIANASTGETATFICSDQILNNMMRLSHNFAKERDYLSALIELDNILAYEPDHTEARQLKERWTNIYNEKYKDQTDKFSILPENSLEWKAKGEFLLKLNLKEEAIDALSRTSKNGSGHSSALYGKGIALLRASQYQDAIDCLREAIRKNPVHYYAIHALGIVYNRTGDYQMALDCLEDSISLRPDLIDAWKQKAFALGQLGRYEDAIKTYNKALILDPDDWKTLSKKSSVLIKLNKLQDAMKCIDSVLEHVPGDADSLFTKGYIYQQQGMYPEALDYINQSLEQKPNNVKALTKKAYVLAIIGKTEEAQLTIQKAMKYNMNNSKTWYYKGVVHHYAREYDDAIRSYQTSLDLDPGVSRVLECKHRAEKMLSPLINKNEENEEHQSDMLANNEVSNLISDINKKFSMGNSNNDLSSN